MTKHTPGLWVSEWTARTNNEPRRGWHIFDPETVDVDGLVADLNAPGVMDNEANANLIAAAPDLLAALERCLALLPERDRPAIARAALDKAAGKPRLCPVCEDGACETKSKDCGQ